ncbi:MAG TPA: hypothetical protein VGA36_04580 [Nitriliruptorales bacterium]
MTAGAIVDEPPLFARVVVDLEPRHLDRTFDYRVGDDVRPTIRVGSRVEVVFAGRRRFGLVADLGTTTDLDQARVRPLRRVLGEHAWASPDDLDLFRWAAARWASPLAHVVRHALPKRVVAVEAAAARAGWYPGEDAPGRRAAREAVLPESLAGWDPYGGATLLTELAAGRPSLHWWWPTADEEVPSRIVELVLAVQAGGRGVLLVTPGPRSVMADAVAAATGAVDVREAKDRALYRAWLEARHGRAGVVIGERGVAFWPVERLGLVIVEEEASAAHKEQRSPRHHVREVALERARRAGAIGLLTGSVPSAGLRALLKTGRVTALRASRDAERRAAPAVSVAPLDPVPTRLPSRGVKALRAATRAGRYGVVLASQRGEGSALSCTSCATMARCERCDALLVRTLDRSGRLDCPRCHHRTTSSWRCPGCGGAELVALAAGARLLGNELARTFDVRVEVLEGYAPDVPPPPAVLVMTRGSVTPAAPGPVGAVILGDLERLAGRPRLDAAEDTLRLAMTLAGWSRQHGVTDAPTLVPVRDGDHGMVRALVAWEPDLFWEAETRRRAPLRFPPVGTIINVDVPTGGPALELPERIGDVLTRRLTGGMTRHQVRTGDRVAAADAIQRIAAGWSADGITDVRVDVEPVDVT